MRVSQKTEASYREFLDQQRKQKALLGLFVVLVTIGVFLFWDTVREIVMYLVRLED